MADNQWEAYLNKQAELLDKGVIDQRQYDDAVRDATVQMKGYSAAMRSSMNQLGNSVLGLGGTMMKGASGASVYNNSISSLADVFASILSMIPFVGKLLGEAVKAGAKYVTAVNEQSDALFDTYQGLTRSGLATGMQDIFDNLHGMGYTMRELGNMTQLFQENAQMLANFGGTAADGAKNFVEIASQIQYSETSTGFKRMGMSVDDINKGIAGYMNIQRAAGQMGNQTNQQLAQSAAAYIEQQDKLAKLTGMAADAQNQTILNAMADQRYNATQMELRDGDAKAKEIAARNDAMLVVFKSQYGDKTARAFQDYASGMMNSEDAQKFRRSFPKAAEMIKKGQGTVAEITQAAQEDAVKTAETFTSLAKGGVANKNITDFAEIVKGQGLNQTQTAKESEEAAKKQQDDQKKGKDPAVKSMVDLTNAQRNQTQAFEQLVNNGIAPVTKGVAVLSEGITAVTGVVGSAVGGRTESMGAGPAPAGGGDASDLIKFAGGNTGTKGNFDQLNAKVREAFNAMVKEYGKPVTINSAKRAADDQKRLYDAWVKAGGSASNPIVQTEFGRVKMPAKPGTSKHEQGKAIDLDDSSFAGLSGLFGKYGFATIKGDPGHIEMPQAATGGILSGPTSGYNAMLHGTEAVVPMKNDSMEVQSEDNGNSEQTKLLARKLQTLDIIISSANKHISTTEEILRKTH